ncbi:MAG TPA: type I restriction endonuclease subunit R [Fervidobacterium sp.]|nr:type I restriction endonuclease subunit R [Fervidobacterium sp.]HOK87543.1 type I restriction endonuclease subunit R [Fervidobacterium sp.]HOM73741.1 type I restriction endonuclease subunit R [Fervidobacterium sp.]HPP17518.1 type I restriction endonuclease subunit R [Fervidobacterium sp.]HRD20115.1 type I restriction endonuclease subunit R [Fervidobacterium sp.]
MPYLGNEESLVELPAIRYIKDRLGYEFIEGEKLSVINGERESLSDVVLINRLKKALKRLNPWMDENSINKAVRYITNANILGTSLLEINEEIYNSLVELNFAVEQDLDGNGKKKFHTVQFIDFENVENNDFLVTRQFEVQTLSGGKIIPDIVVFINGIPVVVIECKSPLLEKSGNENIGKKEAYEQLRRYMNERDASFGEGNPKLFYTNFFTMILNKYHGYIGTISSKYDQYLEWKDPYPFEKSDIEDVENFGQNILLQGVLEKNNLLDLMRNFVLFETESGTTIKKVSRYQQFRAVNKAIDRILNGRDKLQKGGVIWHTQGSGKSITMVFLARKIRRIDELKNSTIVVVTDRIDLDKQIYNTFVRALSKTTTPVRAETISEMKELLSRAQPQIIMTTIQKFENETDEREVIVGEVKTTMKFKKEYEVLTNKSNVIVLADEAHRSQYKDTAANLRKALPNAVFIGFTGTPIDKEDKSTPRTFGGYIDKYSIQQAVDDGATVKIVYEGRKTELQIKGDSLDEIFCEAFEDKTVEEKEAIKQKYANKRAIIEAESRIEDIARDILYHYKENVLPNGFKAQIVCISREACVKYYNALNKYMKDILGEGYEARVIFSGSLNDLPHLKEHFTTKQQQDEIIKRFKKPVEKDKLCFIIVKDMLLTGFDAPIEQVMYLDRPLKEHNLLQAIARVNRTSVREVEREIEEGIIEKVTITKQCGYVVDYYGITNFLEEALSIFEKEDLGTPMYSMDEIYKQMLSVREAAMTMFSRIDKNNLDELVNALKMEDKRAEFEIVYKEFSSYVEALLPLHVGNDVLNDLKWLSYIRAACKAKYEPAKNLDISDCGEKVRKIIEEHLKSKGVVQWIKPITLFEEDFKNKIETLNSDEAKASAMEHAVKHVISVKRDENPVYYTSLLEKLQKILDETENSWIERKKKLEEFIERDVKNGLESEAEKLGLNKKQYALYQTIKKIVLDEDVDLVKEETAVYIASDTEDTVKNITKEVDEILMDAPIDWTTNPTKTNDVQRSIRMHLIKNYYTKLGKDKKDKIDKLTIELLNLAKIHYATKE